MRGARICDGSETTVGHWPARQGLQPTSLGRFGVRRIRADVGHLVEACIHDRKAAHDRSLAIDPVLPEGHPHRGASWRGQSRRLQDGPAAGSEVGRGHIRDNLPDVALVTRMALLCLQGEGTQSEKDKAGEAHGAATTSGDDLGSGADRRPALICYPISLVISRPSRTRSFTALRISVHSRERRPWTQRGCDGPAACPPPAPCIRHTRHSVELWPVHRMPCSLPGLAQRLASAYTGAATICHTPDAIDVQPGDHPTSYSGMSADRDLHQGTSSPDETEDLGSILRDLEAIIYDTLPPDRAEAYIARLRHLLSELGCHVPPPTDRE